MLKAKTVPPALLPVRSAPWAVIVKGKVGTGIKEAPMFKPTPLQPRPTPTWG